MQWDEAETLSRDCEALNGGGFSRLYTLYRERIGSSAERLPGRLGWDAEAESK